MVDTVDSKSAARKGVRVQVPPGVLKPTVQQAVGFFSPRKVPDFDHTRRQAKVASDLALTTSELLQQLG